MTARRRYKPMPPLTRRAERALRKCIREKWEPALKEKHECVSARLMSWRTCALCLEYFEDDCAGCPISQRTGKTSCRGTPYLRLNALFRGVDLDETPETISVAIRAELRFLRDTLRLGLAARQRAKENEK